MYQKENTLCHGIYMELIAPFLVLYQDLNEV
jgi:hypothetical protein